MSNSKNSKPLFYFLISITFVFLSACGGGGSEPITIGYFLGKKGIKNISDIPNTEIYNYPEKGNSIKINAKNLLSNNDITHGAESCGHIFDNYMGGTGQNTIVESYLFIEINKNYLEYAKSLGFFPVHDGFLPAFYNFMEPSTLTKLSYFPIFDSAYSSEKDVYYHFLTKPEPENTYCYPD